MLIIWKSKLARITLVILYEKGTVKVIKMKLKRHILHWIFRPLHPSAARLTFHSIVLSFVVDVAVFPPTKNSHLNVMLCLQLQYAFSLCLVLWKHAKSTLRISIKFVENNRKNCTMALSKWVCKKSSISCKSAGSSFPAAVVCISHLKIKSLQIVQRPTFQV